MGKRGEEKVGKGIEENGEGARRVWWEGAPGVV